MTNFFYDLNLVKCISLYTSKHQIFLMWGQMAVLNVVSGYFWTCKVCWKNKDGFSLVNVTMWAMASKGKSYHCRRGLCSTVGGEVKTTNRAKTSKVASLRSLPWHTATKIKTHGQTHNANMSKLKSVALYCAAHTSTSRIYNLECRSMGHVQGWGLTKKTGINSGKSKGCLDKFALWHFRG